VDFPLTGSAGFLEARGTTLTVHTAPGADDPLHGPLPGRPVGLLAIDLDPPPGTRQRHARRGR
jgi:hypothetical protein